MKTKPVRTVDPLTLTVLEDRCTPALFPTIFVNEHVDVRLDYANSTWNEQYRNVADGTVSTTEGSLTYVPPSAMIPAPTGSTFSFLGTGPSGSIYLLPQSKNTTLPFLGISGEGVTAGTFAPYRPTDTRVTASAAYLRMDVVGVRGPGRFSLYQVNAAGTPIVWVSTTDGISSKDLAYVAVGKDEHYNWAFTDRGIYEIDIQTTAFVGSNQTSPTVSGIKTLYFSVDPAAPVNSVPPTGVNSNSGAAVVFSSRSNPISVSGPTTAPAPVSVTISSGVGKGLLSTGTTANVGIISGNGSPSVNVIGTIAQVNLALNGLTYRPAAGFNGVDAITILTSDNGEYKPAPLNEQTDSDSIGVVVSGNTATGGGAVVPPAVVPPAFPAGSSQALARRLAVSAPSGVASSVTVADTETRASLSTFSPYGSFTGGASVAVADITGDGVADIVTAAGPGGGPHVIVFDGATFRPIRSFFAYDPGFRGGVSLALADVNGDGTPDIVTGAGAGGGPHVKVFDGATGTVIRSFFAFESTFTGGVSVAAGDLTGDGVADLVAGAGAGGGPAVAVFNGRNLSEVRRFFAYAPTFTGGVNVAVGDVTGTFESEIIVGAGPGGGPHVQVFNGLTLNAVSSFFAVPLTPEENRGVFVAVADFNRDRKPEIVAVTQSPKSTEAARIRTFDLTIGLVTRPIGSDLSLTEEFFGAVNVGGIAR